MGAFFTKLSLPEDLTEGVCLSPCSVQLYSGWHLSLGDNQQPIQSISSVNTHPEGENVVTWGEAKRKDTQVLRNNLGLNSANEESRGDSGWKLWLVLQHCQHSNKTLLRNALKYCQWSELVDSGKKSGSENAFLSKFPVFSVNTPLSSCQAAQQRCHRHQRHFCWLYNKQRVHLLRGNIQKDPPDVTHHFPLL